MAEEDGDLRPDVQYILGAWFNSTCGLCKFIPLDIILIRERRRYIRIKTNCRKCNHIGIQERDTI